MESIFTTLAATVSALFLSVVALFASSPTTPTPQDIAPITDVVVEVGMAAEIEATSDRALKSVAPTQDPVAEAYKLGREVGRAEGAIDVIQKQSVKEERQRTLRTNNNGSMNGEVPANVPTVEPALGSIKFINPFPEQGIGRQFKAVTDPNIERWDQAPDMANYVVIGIEVYDSNGSRIKDHTTNIRVTSDRDPSQDRSMGGKTNYQYLFREVGEHTLTFRMDGIEEKSITLIAE